MKIESAAGEFEFDIDDLKVNENQVVLTGKMGVWEAETSMSQADMKKFLKLVVGKPSFWGFLLKLPFSKSKKESSNDQA